MVGTPSPQPSNPVDTDEAAAVRRHITFKTSIGELKPHLAEHMLTALDHGAAPDYATLFDAATFQPPPPTCFHTAPVTARDTITRHGLQPANGTNWADKATGQPTGVYLTTTPDTTGIWSHWDTWDIWAVDITDLDWDHDRLNPGCYRTGPIPPDRLTLYTDPTTGRTGDHTYPPVRTGP